MDKHLILSEETKIITPNEIGATLNDYEILQKIGKGGYGFIAKVKSKRNHGIYAMKMIDLTKLKDPREKDLSMNEIKLLQGLNSPHIIKYYHYFIDNNRLYIIMDFMNNGDLKGFIEANMAMNKVIPEDDIVELFYQCMAGLFFCHKNNIIHRDIKPANLFMTETKDIKIGDFGISAEKRPKGDLNTLTIGTPQFMAPEMFNNTGYDSKIDVYAMGCTFHAICYFSVPREIVVINDMGGKRGVIQDITPDRFQNYNAYSNELKNLIYRMIDRNPLTRPNSEQVFSDIKKLYYRTHKPNSSISAAYNGIYSFKNLTLFMEKQKGMLNQDLGNKPISNSFTYYLTNISNPNQEEILNSLREILTYENSTFPDPGQIDPADLIKFILQRIHLETNTGTNKSINIIGNSIQNYLQNLQFSKSCILDFFFGTLQKKTFCNTCKQTMDVFTNYYQLTFDIDQALKIGMASNNLLVNYFINQNKSIINYPGICNYCHQQAYLQESKMIFSLPYNLVVCFKGEKNNYNNQYISYFMTLNFAQLGLASSPKDYFLKAIIKCYMQNDQKYYSSIYLDPKTNQWFLSSGYTKQLIPNPAMHNIGDVVALFYSAVV